MNQQHPIEDVYKRQTPQTAVQTNPKNVERITFEDPIAAAEKMVKTLKAEKVILSTSVSYTHLDVYKRQAKINKVITICPGAR